MAVKGEDVEVGEAGKQVRQSLLASPKLIMKKKL